MASNRDEFELDITSVIEDSLDLQRWNFKLAFSDMMDFNGALVRGIVYDSEWCRIKFHYSQSPPPDHYELHIYYGRLHAPIHSHVMTWQGEKRYCWHGIGLLHLYFLDGVSPTETLSQVQNGKLPSAIGEFKKSELGRKLQQESRLKYPFARENAIWQRYGVSLFELFDLRQENLWEEYAVFLKEYYRLMDEHLKIKGIATLTFDLPLWKIC